MNILKLAKHLKTFTLDEIEMIAESDVKTELEQLLKEGKLTFEQGQYEFIEKVTSIDYGIFAQNFVSNNPLLFETGTKYFLEKYAKTTCTKRTYETYESIFRVNILPFFSGKIIQELTIDDIKRFYTHCKTRNVGHRRLKNTLTLLNQLLKYCKSQGLVSKCCKFQIKRLSEKNQFSIDRIIFED